MTALTHNDQPDLRKLIAQLERILPGLENSSSSAEDAMIRALPKVIAALSRAEEMEAALQEIADRHVPDQPAEACDAYPQSTRRPPDAQHSPRRLFPLVRQRGRI